MFTASRSLVVRESQGRRPYLVLSRDGWASVVRLGLVVQRDMTDAESWTAAHEC